jgi:toxin CptA
MVAAVDEVVNRRRASRFLALGEAALWVTGGLFVASHVGLLMRAPAGFALSAGSAVGGALLGAGALVNRACVFGTVARFGSGEWAYALTPLSFFLGCLTAAPLIGGAMPVALTSPPPLFDLPLWTAGLILPVLAWRGYEAIVAVREMKFAAHIWSPHQATTVIGVTFVVTLLTVGGWAYTELLSELARRGGAMGALPRILLFFALLLGAVAGGWTSGRLRRPPPNLSAIVRCLGGGWLMGLGSLLTPGGNDGLVLVGIPLLYPHAWAAIAAMIATIAVGLLIQGRLAARMITVAD